MEESPKKKLLKRYLYMLVGALCYALSVDLFLAKHGIVAGGVTGLGTTMNFLIPQVGIGVFSMALNIPILLLGLKSQGKKFIFRCFITSMTINVFIDLFAFLSPMTDQPILASIYGGVLQGIGIGLFCRYRMSSGGTELLGRVILPLFPGVGLASMVAILDGIVVVVGTIITKNPENMLRALIVIFLSAKVSDMIISGLNYAKLCYIITDKADEVSDALLKNSPRGVTKLDGEGMYTRQAKNVLLTVVKRNQLSQLRTIVQDVDERAFVIVSEATEVLGVGFQSIQGEPLDD